MRGFHGEGAATAPEESRKFRSRVTNAPAVVEKLLFVLRVRDGVFAVSAVELEYVRAAGGPKCVVALTAALCIACIPHLSRRALAIPSSDVGFAHDRHLRLP